MSTTVSPNELLSNSTNQALSISYWEHIFTAVLVSTIAVIGIIGNSMIIMAVAFSRKLQTPTNAFVTSLSVADLLTSIFLIPYVIGLLGQNDWPFPKVEWLCAASGFVIFNCTGASMYNLAAIGMNRLLLITKPLAYHRIFTSWKLCILVAMPWFIPLSTIVTFVLTGNGGFGYDKSDLSCSDLDLHKNAKTFDIVQTFIALPIPLTMIIVSYIWIYVYLKKHFHKQKENIISKPASRRSKWNQMSNQASLTSIQQVTSSEEGIDNPCHSPTEQIGNIGVSAKDDMDRLERARPAEVNKLRSIGNSLAHSIKKRKGVSNQQVEITKNLFVVVCTFFAFFIPYFVLNPVLGSSHAIYYLRLLLLANSAINFVIYARKHPEFKIVLGCMMRCAYADIPQPSKLLKFFISKKT